MAKKMNGTVAKRDLLKSIEVATQKVESDRWLTQTDEGREFVRNENAKRAQALLKEQFKLGQLVWVTDVLTEEDLIGTPAKVANRCSKITSIGNYDLVTEMLYAQINGVKYEEYTDWLGTVNKKGDNFIHQFYRLERHVAKSGNVWWKVIN